MVPEREALAGGNPRPAAADGKNVNLVTMSESCEHLQEVRQVTASANGCEECLKIGARWVHLRICLICGKVGCCDQSPNRHATKHFHAAGHAVMRSWERGEDWGWCYVDELFFDPMPGPVPREHPR